MFPNGLQIMSSVLGVEVCTLITDLVTTLHGGETNIQDK
jgi:hypothetical protein